MPFACSTSCAFPWSMKSTISSKEPFIFATLYVCICVVQYSVVVCMHYITCAVPTYNHAVVIKKIFLATFFILFSLSSFGAEIWYRDSPPL